MTFGTDAGVYPHGDNAKQFAKMVQWGMTPLQAIQAATLNAGEALGRSGDVGQIAPGDPADLHKLAARGGNADRAPFRSSVSDFYFTNPIARCSAVMAECSALAEGRAAAAA